jgi:hypothetical protein
MGLWRWIAIGLAAILLRLHLRVPVASRALASVAPVHAPSPSRPHANEAVMNHTSRDSERLIYQKLGWPD